MSVITTHVLDTVLGKPAAGVAVRLDKQVGGGWIEVSTSSEAVERVQDTPCDWAPVSTGLTDADGRCRDLAPEAEKGVYRLTFDTGAYLKRIGRAGIYPEISVTFTCGGESHYHLPLLLSDNSYTTYRGS
ncbi:MAG: hydroxyisourate hydrolase [Terracidiphilus sp.]